MLNKLQHEAFHSMNVRSPSDRLHVKLIW